MSPGAESAEAAAGAAPLPPSPEAAAAQKPVDPRYAPALAQVREEMASREDVVALLFFGSVQRGQARPGSDLDLCAVTNGSRRWTRGSIMHGVEVQVQFAPVRAWKSTVERGVPAVVSAFATGELLFDRTGDGAKLTTLADGIYRAGPPALTDFARDQRRYWITNMVRDLEELPGHSAEAGILGGVAVMEALTAWCALQGLWPDRKPQVMMRQLRERDPALTARVEACYASFSPAGAIRIADAVLEMLGGRLYQLTTPPEPA